MVPGSGARGKYELQGHTETLAGRPTRVNVREADPTWRTYAVRHVPAYAGAMGRAGRVVMFNDADCGFCMRTAALVPRLGVDVEARVLQEVDLGALGIDPERALVEMAALDASGAVHHGHEAWAAILATGPLPWRVVGTLMRSRAGAPAARAAYAWVSANRSRLPGGTPACALPPSGHAPDGTVRG